uniref:Invertebrate defensins family profile domain-containing protein n=1 Tax=Cuerna arida TaxID=1464854 RepID=A0A1B6GY10_9HEMI
MTSIQLTLCLLLMVLATLTVLAQGIPPNTTITTTTNTTKTTTTTNSTVTVHTENLNLPDLGIDPPPSACRRSIPKHRVACQNWCLKQGRPGGKCKKNKCMCKPKRQPYN